MTGDDAGITTPTTDRCPRKVRVVKASKEYKVKSHSEDGKGKTNQIVSLMPLGGVIELIAVWNDDATDDGFDPFLKNTVRECGEFSERSGIFCLAERRAPPGMQYDYLPSPQKQRMRNGKPFARHWYMRLVDASKNEDSVEKRRRIAHSIRHFLQKSEAKARKRRAAANPNGDKSTGLRNYYVVPEHWDLTPESREPLDHYVTDTFVAQAITNSMQPDGENSYQNFATQYPADAAFFYSGPPYCDVAVTTFGYQNPYHFRADEDSSHDGSNDESQKTGESKEHAAGPLDDYFGNISE